MIATIYDPDDLTPAEIDALWKAGVIMEDWDYLVVAPPESLCEGREDDPEKFGQSDSTLERIMADWSERTWYRVTFRGELKAIGVAYHA